jgi:hypothetical protein
MGDWGYGGHITHFSSRLPMVLSASPIRTNTSNGFHSAAALRLPTGLAIKKMTTPRKQSLCEEKDSR